MSDRSAEPQATALQRKFVQERAVQLGPEGQLFGVFASSSRSDPSTGRETVIFLNAGVIHRVGPHRLHVNLARHLASRGIPSLRLDLSGIGDSRAVPGSLSFRESAVVDARAAMDWLVANTGASRFVLFGLCSGADNALAGAAADERVAGVVVLDPPAYVTRRSRLRAVTSRAERPVAVARLVVAALTRRLVGRLARRNGPADDAPRFVGGRAVPPPAEYRTQLLSLAERRVSVLAVYSGALGERYNHADQLFELFPDLRGKIDVAYFPGANHTFTDLLAQADLIATVSTWLERRR